MLWLHVSFDDVGALVMKLSDSHTSRGSCLIYTPVIVQVQWHALSSDDDCSSSHTLAVFIRASYEFLSLWCPKGLASMLL